MDNAFGQPQNVVVLGGSSDIARAITKKLCAARAHTVVLAGRSQELLTSSPPRPKSTARPRPTPFSLTPRTPRTPSAR